jgi:hypothetical protein
MSLVDELTKLDELRRSGALNDAEFAKAKAALLDEAPAGHGRQIGEHLANQLAEVKYQNELAQIDREWEIERRQYLIQGQDGIAHEPTAGMGLGMAIGVGVFGVIWTIFAASLTSGGPDEGPFSVAKVIFPLFGVVFTVMAIAFGIHTYSRAQKYQAAFAAYKAKRARVQLEQAATADRPPERGPSSHDIRPA